MTHSVGREVIRQQGRLRTAQIKKPQTAKSGVEEGPEKAPKGEANEQHLRDIVYTVTQYNATGAMSARSLD